MRGEEKKGGGGGAGGVRQATSMAMAMAMSRSVLARVARGGHPVYQPLLRAEGNLTADTLGKRFLSGFKVRAILCWTIYP